jgi:hypothetical protein
MPQLPDGIIDAALPSLYQLEKLGQLIRIHGDLSLIKGRRERFQDVFFILLGGDGAEKERYCLA